MEAILASIIAAATPLVFASIGETITERSGVINLSLEGSMMLAALAGFAAGYHSGVWWVGFLAAAAVGAAVGPLAGSGLAAAFGFRSAFLASAVLLLAMAGAVAFTFAADRHR